jgi:hypothetical protein
MKNKIFLFIVIAQLLVNSVFSQKENRKTLQDIITTIEKEYIGYKYFITPKNRFHYEQFKKELLDYKRAILRNVNSSISDYLDYFKDVHLSTYDTKNLSHLDYEVLLKKSTQLIGIWKYEGIDLYIEMYNFKDKTLGRVFYDGRGIRKKGSDYLQVVNSITDHDFNFLIFGNRGTAAYPVNIVQNKIISNGIVKYRKVRGILNEKSESAQYPIMECKKVNDTSIYLKLADFSSLKKSDIDSILKVHHNDIITSSNFIIDLRDNEGGSTKPSLGLVKYISNGHFKFMDNYIYASDSLLSDYKKFCSSNNATTSSQYDYYCNSFIKILESNLGKIIKDTSLSIEDTIIYSNPKNVAILINKNTASAAEIVAFSFRENGKAKIFGINSMGAFDTGASSTYVFNNTIHIDIPTELHSTSLTKRYDYIGIQPDVPIPPSTKDWVQFVVEYLKKNK